jgi:hypothetical protein
VVTIEPSYQLHTTGMLSLRQLNYEMDCCPQSEFVLAGEPMIAINFSDTVAVSDSFTSSSVVSDVSTINFMSICCTVAYLVVSI